MDSKLAIAVAMAVGIWGGYALKQQQERRDRDWVDAAMWRARKAGEKASG